MGAHGRPSANLREISLFLSFKYAQNPKAWGRRRCVRESPHVGGDAGAGILGHSSLSHATPPLDLPCRGQRRVKRTLSRPELLPAYGTRSEGPDSVRRLRRGPRLLGTNILTRDLSSASLSPSSGPAVQPRLPGSGMHATCVQAESASPDACRKTNPVSCANVSVRSLSSASPADSRPALTCTGRRSFPRWCLGPGPCWLASALSARFPSPVVRHKSSRAGRRR